jgi:enoyl-CoA hydratase
MMASFKTIIYEEKEDVAVVTLNRPDKLNALSLLLLDELNQIMGEIDLRDDLKAVVITGGQKVFCAGADINIFSGLSTPEEAYGFVQRIKYALASVNRISKPTIAAICGYALGGGLELCMYCDIRIAAEDAKLSVPEIDLGAFPAAGGTQVLPRLIGAPLAKEMIFIGKPIDGREAYRIGLVNKIYPKEKVFEEAMNVAKALAKKPAYAIRTIKRLVDNGLQMDLARAMVYESSTFLGIWASHDFKEGSNAFLEKRKAVFKGK